MLQQGLKPSPPEGYDYDSINTDVLLNRMAVKPDGMSYRVLRKIRELVAGGATVLGPKPLRSPDLAGYPNADVELQALAGEMWGDLDGISRTRRDYGRGKVVWGLPLAEVLGSLPVPKDFEYSRSLDADMPWIHRRAGDTDLYYVVNRTDRHRTWRPASA